MIEISLNKTWTAVDQVIGDLFSFFVKGIKLGNRLFIYLFIYFLFIYLSRSIQFSRACLNWALIKYKNKDIKTLKIRQIIKL